MQSCPSAVLVPVDGSAYAERAIEPARKFAAMLNISVGAVQCVGAEDQDDAVDDSYLESITQDRHLTWYQAAEYTDVPAGILAAAKERNAIICMSTHGHGRGEAIMGSHAEEILRRSTESSQAGVVLVGRAYEAESPQRFRSIVVPLDGTSVNESVCERAAQWAIRCNVALRFVTVVEETEPSLRADHPYPHRFGPAGDPKEYIDAVVKRFERPGLVVTGEVLLDPLSPASGLEKLLRDGLDSLVIMPTHFRTGMQRLLHGSHAGDIIDLSPVLVLVYGETAQDKIEQT